ncbi:prepilin-type N-terminal cleavage/methylation domain-containing protein, partial [candidate division WOR-3 bacterium]|nr:prepilin-type N-terminal cleavage/methylation domain-containing protein [candidate division WOR-3 bacterium]
MSTDRRAGMTLLELLVVLMVLSLILTAAVKAWDVTLERGR